MTHNAVRTDVGEAGPGSWVDQQGRVDGAALVYTTIEHLVPEFIAALSTTVTEVRVGETRIHMIEASNINTADAYLQFFDRRASAVTHGTDTPVFSLFVPKGDGTNRGGMDKAFAVPLYFLEALSVAATTTATGNTAPTTGLVVNMAVQ